MATNGFLNNTQLDFASYKQSLKTYLSQQTQFRDYDFEGSNLSVLLDLLAYNTYHNAMYLNMIGSEMFLDTAQLRESIISHAKELNYTPRSRSASRIEVDVVASVNNSVSPTTITLPANYRISGTANNGLVYNFYTKEPVVLESSNSYSVSNVFFYEGSLKTEAFLVSSANAQFVINSSNVDISTVSVTVQKSSTEAVFTPWSRSEELFNLNANSEVFFIQGYRDFQYSITFGNGVVGKQLTPGNILLVSYLETNGVDANYTSTFSTVESVDIFPASTFSLVYSGSSYGGAYAEDNNSIRYNAIRGFTNQNRAITSEDTVSLIKANFPSIETVVAYGGEEATPKRYGKIVISAKPIGSEVLSDSLKNEIVDFLSDKTSLSVEPLIVNPEYLYLDISSRVKYNINQTTKTSSQLASNVVTAITSFNTSYLSDFGSDLRFSKLSSAIDAADVSIISNDTQVRISKRITPSPGVSYSERWSFENELYNENVRYVLPVGHEAIVESTPFVYDGYTAYIQDNGTGTLYVYALVNNITTVLNNNVGTVDYNTGLISINNLIVDSYTTDAIKIYARTENADIDTLTNKILLIDPEDITVTMTGIRI